MGNAGGVDGADGDCWIASRWAGVICGCACVSCCICEGTGRAGIGGLVWPFVDTTGVSGICGIGGARTGGVAVTDSPMLLAMNEEGARGVDAVNSVLAF